jgi:hypothetical protein
MSATCGPMSPAPFASFDPDASVWRTSQLTLGLDSTPSSLTLPAWGSMRSGELFERPTPAPATGGPDCSSSLPTPTGQDGKQTVDNEAERARNPHTLWATVGALLPTPSAEESQPTDEWAQEALDAGIDPAARLYLPGRRWHSQRTLSRVAVTLIPTPTARDGDRRSLGSPEVAARRMSPEEGSRRNLDDAIAAMRATGARTPPPSNDGNGSSDDQPQLRLWDDS